MTNVNFASNFVETDELNILLKNLQPESSSNFEVVQNKNVRSGLFQGITEFLVVTIAAGSIIDLIKDYVKEFLKDKILKRKTEKQNDAIEINFIHIVIYKQGDVVIIDKNEIDEDIEQKINNLRSEDIESIITLKK